MYIPTELNAGEPGLRLTRDGTVTNKVLVGEDYPTPTPRP